MSSQYRKSSSVSKFCKVCKDAGKSEAEYTSHFVRETRDVRSKVVCPTLLTNECRYCGKLGHTLQFCKIRQASHRKNASQQLVVSKSVPQVAVHKVESNRFVQLCDSDDEEELSYPSLPQVGMRVVDPPTNKHLNFAAALISEKPSQNIATIEVASENVWKLRSNGKNKIVDISSPTVSAPVFNAGIIPESIMLYYKRNACLDWADSDMEDEYVPEDEYNYNDDIEYEDDDSDYDEDY